MYGLYNKSVRHCLVSAATGERIVVKILFLAREKRGNSRQLAKGRKGECSVIIIHIMVRNWTVFNAGLLQLAAFSWKNVVSVDFPWQIYILGVLCETTSQ